MVPKKWSGELHLNRGGDSFCTVQYDQIQAPPKNRTLYMLMKQERQLVADTTYSAIHFISFILPAYELPPQETGRLNEIIDAGSNPKLAKLVEWMDQNQSASPQERNHLVTTTLMYVLDGDCPFAITTLCNLRNIPIHSYSPERICTTGSGAVIFFWVLLDGCDAPEKNPPRISRHLKSSISFEL